MSRRARTRPNKRAPWQDQDNNKYGGEMKQPIKTPPIATCARCGADAKCIDWDFRDRWRVMCNNNHTSTNECATNHRAICLWNNAQTKMRNAEVSG